MQDEHKATPIGWDPGQGDTSATATVNTEDGQVVDVNQIIPPTVAIITNEAGVTNPRVVLTLDRRHGPWLRELLQGYGGVEVLEEMTLGRGFPPTGKRDPSPDSLKITDELLSAMHFSKWKRGLDDNDKLDAAVGRLLGNLLPVSDPMAARCYALSLARKVLMLVKNRLYIQILKALSPSGVSEVRITGAPHEQIPPEAVALATHLSTLSCGMPEPARLCIMYPGNELPIGGVDTDLVLQPGHAIRLLNSIVAWANTFAKLPTVHTTPSLEPIMFSVIAYGTDPHEVCKPGVNAPSVEDVRLLFGGPSYTLEETQAKLAERRAERAAEPAPTKQEKIDRHNIAIQSRLNRLLRNGRRKQQARRAEQRDRIRAARREQRGKAGKVRPTITSNFSVGTILLAHQWFKDHGGLIDDDGKAVPALSNMQIADFASKQFMKNTAAGKRVPTEEDRALAAQYAEGRWHPAYGALPMTEAEVLRAAGMQRAINKKEAEARIETMGKLELMLKASGFKQAAQAAQNMKDALVHLNTPPSHEQIARRQVERQRVHLIQKYNMTRQLDADEYPKWVWFSGGVGVALTIVTLWPQFAWAGALLLACGIVAGCASSTKWLKDPLK